MPTATAAPFVRFLQQHARSLLISAALLLAYALAGFYWVPSLITQYATEYVRDTLHRQLMVGQVQFNPFTLSLQITQVQLSEADGEPIGRFDYLLVNAEFSSLLTGSYRFKEIELASPSLQAIVNADGKFNLELSDDTAEHPADSNATLPDIRIGELRLIDGQVHLEDRSLAKPFATDLQPIEFTLKNFRTEPQYGNVFHFSGASEAGETVDWQGNFTVQPFSSKGSLQIQGLRASTLQGYLQDALPFRLLSGVVNLQGEYQLTASDNTELTLTLPTIAVQNAQVAPLSGEPTPWVTLPSMQLSDTSVSLQSRSVHIKQLALNEAQLSSWFDKDYNLNLLELLGPDEPPSDMPWISRVDRIEINNATVAVEDRSIQPAAAFTLSPVHMQIENFSTAPNTTIQLATQLRVNDHADVTTKGSVDLDTLASQMQVSVKQFALQDASAYANTATDMLIQSGTLDAEGDVYYKGTAKNKNPEIKFTGAVRIDNLSTQDKAEQKDFIKWRSVALNNLRYQMAPDALEIDQVSTDELYGRVIIDADGSTNIQHVLRIQPATKSSNADNKPTRNSGSANSKPMRIKLGKVLVRNGSANFTDYSVQPVFATGMQRLNGSISNLSSVNGTRAQVQLEGSVDNYAPVAINGEANFLAADTYSDIALKFSNMELTTFNPYSGKFAGYSIAKGKLSTELRYQITERKLAAQHHVVIDQLEFGAATDSKDAVPLPIKLAVALLKDRNGVIDLQLPVNGSLDDPQFKVGPIVWKVCVNLLTKIVTAPFSALGKLFGDSGDELAYVDFAPGSSQLAASELDKLNKLAKGMVERPALKLNVPLTVVSDQDAAAMNAMLFNNAVNEVLPNAATATAAQRLTALSSLYQRKLGSAPVFPTADASTDLSVARVAYLEAQLKPLYSIAAADRDLLTRARADAVQAALLTNAELSADRIYLVARSNEATSPAGVVRMALQLE